MAVGQSACPLVRLRRLQRRSCLHLQPPLRHEALPRLQQAVTRRAGEIDLTILHPHLSIALHALQHLGRRAGKEGMSCLHSSTTALRSCDNRSRRLSCQDNLPGILDLAMLAASATSAARIQWTRTQTALYPGYLRGSAESFH